MDVHVLVLVGTRLGGAVGTESRLTVVVLLARERPAVPAPLLCLSGFADLAESANAHTRTYALQWLEDRAGTSTPDRSIPDFVRLVQETGTNLPRFPLTGEISWCVLTTYEKAFAM